MGGIRFAAAYFSSTDRYAVGVDLKEGGYYTSFPVANGAVIYEEFFRLTPAQFEEFQVNQVAARRFIDQCRRGERTAEFIFRAVRSPGRARRTPNN